eukprot:2872639-Rhodomonas_salina.1
MREHTNSNNTQCGAGTNYQCNVFTSRECDSCIPHMLATVSNNKRPAEAAPMQTETDLSAAPAPAKKQASSPPLTMPAACKSPCEMQTLLRAHLPDELELLCLLHTDEVCIGGQYEDDEAYGFEPEGSWEAWECLVKEFANAFHDNFPETYAEEAFTEYPHSKYLTEGRFIVKIKQSTNVTFLTAEEVK